MTSILNKLFNSRLFNSSGALVVVLFLTLATATTTALPSIRASYRTYLSLGPGGIPHNFLGFVLQACLRPIARSDLRASTDNPSESVVDGERRYAPYGRRSFLSSSSSSSKEDTTIAIAAGGDGGGGGQGGGGGLPTRKGDRPAVPSFVAPQRQVSMQSTEGMVARMQGFLGGLAEVNSGVLEIGPSGLEGAWHTAVFLKREGAGEVPGYMGMAKREIVHVHSEGSSHVTVSLVDGEEAVRKGWAERHPLSGVRKLLPWSYVMVYAPRDDDEYEVWTRLVVAGCMFVSGGKEIKMVES
ncbi:hypothetical protein C8A00DRAFT_34854 [Chaetomidium leptoderma]|uniref:Luciferase domain-containing protein n=1 Tax=Chaetomidium leptoderma TaxID=669021 RepID=A0AAN6ZW86_9PEZI|nr:hypothetical protein C8A00DRAFT_34854 [Chaetomidium leptoderma]